MSRPELLSPLALDFLWESLGSGELPYPLRVRSHGETTDERSALRHRVCARVRSTPDRPSSAAAYL